MNDEDTVNEMNPIEQTDVKVESEEFFHMSNEDIVNEMKPIEQTDIKVKSEEFCLTNDDQGNYDGVMWMIIFVDLLRIFCCCFNILIQC